MTTDPHFPVLRNWRLLSNSALVGEVIGHPRVGDDWIITGRLVEPLNPVAGRVDGVAFGDLRVERGRQGLRLPTYMAQKTPAQDAMFGAVLAAARATTPEVDDGG